MPSQTINPSEGLLDAEVAEFLRASSQAQIRTVSKLEEAKGVNANLQEIVKQAAQSKANIEFQAGTAELETQNATRAAVRAATVDPANGADIILQLMNQVRDANVRTIQQAQKVAKMQSTTLWEDPLKFVVDNFHLPDEERKLEAAVLETKVLDNRLGATAAATDSVKKIYQAQAEVLTKGVIEDRTRIVAADALAKVEQLKIDGIKYDIDSVNAIAGASKDRISALVALKGAKNADTQLLLSLESAELSKKRFEFETQFKQEQAEAKAAGKNIDELNLEYINRSRAARGAPLLTREQFATYAKLTKKTPEIEHDLLNGMRIAATKVNHIGATPAESLEVLREFPSDLPALRQETAALISEVERMVTKNPAIDQKNKNLVAGELNRAVKAQVDQQYENITRGNLFDVGDLSSYIGTAPGTGISDLSNLSLSRKVLQPLAAAKVPLNDTAQVLGYVSSALQKGQISSSEALQLSDIYRKASLINQTARGFTNFGIVVKDNGAKYQVRVGGWMNKQTIDMNDPTSLSTYFAKNLAASMAGGTASEQLNNSFLGAP